MARNAYTRCKDLNVKQERDDAQCVYVTLCKRKCMAYDKLQTDILLEMKYTDPRNYWQQIKPRKSRSVDNISNDVFREYFKTLYMSNVNTSICTLDYNVFVETLDKEFTVYEIETGIRHLKLGKSAGDDNIKSEFIKYESGNLKFVLTSLFNKLYEQGHFPTAWSTGIIVPIFKKGEKDNPANYRGITLTRTMGKLFTHLLNKRINQWSSDMNIISQCQFAYRTSFSTIDAIFVLNTLLTHALCTTSVYVAFIDLSKAFDGISRNMMLHKLMKYRISTKMFNIIRDMYTNITSKVRTSEGVCDDFAQDKGLMQGESLSPTLFSMYINDIVELMNSTPHMGIVIHDTKISVLKYADDIVLLSRTSKGLQAGLDVLHQFCTDNMLSVNTKKSEVMCVSKRRPRNMPPALIYNSNKLKWVDHFKYLGVIFTRTNNPSKCVKHMCTQANRAQSVLDVHVLKHSTVSIHHIFELYDCLIKPVLTYSCEVWGANEVSDIDVLHLQYIKKILRVKSNTNTSMIYVETGRYPLSIHIKACIIKYWIKLINSEPNRLIYIIYQEMLRNTEQYKWIEYVRKTLQCHGFGYVWDRQQVDDSKTFMHIFEQRSKDMFIQQCFTDMNNSSRCRLYREIQTTYGTVPYISCNINANLRMYYSKLRLSSHKLMVERGRWAKPQIQYTDRRCTLCDSGDIEDEYHIILLCDYFSDIRTKYIKQYYYRRPSMQKFIDLMNTSNKRDHFRYMILIKLIFQRYSETLSK